MIMNLLIIIMFIIFKYILSLKMYLKILICYNIMDNNYIETNLKEKLSVFITQLKTLYSNNESQLLLLENLEKINNDNFGLKSNLYNFYESLGNEDLFKLFLRSKIKLFSTKTEETNKVSESLFGPELTLKSIFNNRSKDVKDNLWRYLHLFYLLIESNLENKSEDKINKLSKLLDNNNESKKIELSTSEMSDKVKKDILNVDVNDSTNNLIDDIVSSFQTSLDGNSENPFDCIMDITEKITSKYKDKLASGEIELDKMMGSITSTLPGIGNLIGKKEEPKEKVIIDDNFSTDQVELGNKDEEKKGFQLSGMMKMMNSMNGKGGGPNLKGLMDVMGKLNNVKTDEDAKELKGEMDTFLEKELGLDVSKLNETINKIESKEPNLFKKNLNVVDENQGMIEGVIGPPHTRGEMEPPKGEKNMGSWTAGVYTDEQQQRLGVDESGQLKVVESNKSNPPVQLQYNQSL